MEETNEIYEKSLIYKLTIISVFRLTHVQYAAYTHMHKARNK